MNHKNRRSKPDVSPPRAATEARLGGWLPLLLILLGVAVYANGLSGPFVFDDVNLIEHNPRAQEWTLKNVDSERPLLFYTLALNYQLGGFTTWGYKVFNLAVHLAAALALFGLVRRTLLLPRFGEQFRDTAAGLAFAAAALWVVHPLTTESVTYIVHRSESMMGMFALLMFYCTVRGSQAPLGWPWYAAAVVAGFLGFGSKQWMIAVPVVLLLYDRIMVGGSWMNWARQRGVIYAALLIPVLWIVWINAADVTQRLKTSRPAAATMAPAATHTGARTGAPAQGKAFRTADSTSAAISPSASAALSSNDFEYGFPRRVSVLRYVRSQPGVVAHYLRLVVWPYPLCVDYFWKAADTNDRIILPAILIGALLLATGLALWRYPAWGFLGAAFFLLLAPSSSIVPIEDIAADRRMYLPLVPVIALLVMAAWQVLGWMMRQDATPPAVVEHRRRFRGLLLLVVVTAVWGSLTVLRNFAYANDIELWERVVQQVEHNSRARVNLARALTNEADRQTERKHRDAYYALALKYLLEAEPLAPKSSFVQAQIGHVLAQQGHSEEAVRRFRKALALNDENPLFHLNLALLLERKGTLQASDEAMAHFQKAVQLGVGKEFQQAEAHAGLARSLASRKRWEDAIGEYQKALDIEPDRIKYGIDFGMLLVQAGRLQDAHEQLMRTCAIDRQHTAQGQTPVVEAYQYLALVCAELKRDEEAIAAAEEALRLAENSGQPQKAAELRQLIEQLRTDRS